MWDPAMRDPNEKIGAMEICREENGDEISGVLAVSIYAMEIGVTEIGEAGFCGDNLIANICATH